MDRADGYFDPGAEPFELVEIGALGIPDLARFCFQYNILELNTAVKPYLLEHLLDRSGVDRVVYLDPDIWVTGDCGEVEHLLNERSIVLTPHLTAPIEDHARPTELDLLRAGVYNLGFIGVADSPTTRRFLAWWQRRLYRGCLMAPDRGMHVDQRWIDLVPGMFDDVHVLRGEGFNVAYWNLHSRRLIVADGHIRVNEHPCQFLHFSGVDPEDLESVSRHQTRYRLEGLGDAAPVFESYARRVLANGYRETRRWPYAFGTFSNGVPLTDVMRRMYWELGDQVDRFGDPFAAEGDTSFFEWLRDDVGGEEAPDRWLSRLWHGIYLGRPDVQRAYPDVLGRDREPFLEWVAGSGRREHGIHELLTVVRRGAASWAIGTPRPAPLPRPAAPAPNGSSVRRLRRWAAQSRFVGPPLRRLRRRLAPRGAAPAPPPAIVRTARPGAAVLRSRPFGVNVAGYLRAETGVGEAARASVRALEAAGLPHLLNDFVDTWAANVDTTLGVCTEHNPYRVNLVHVNADQVEVFARHQREEYFQGRHNVGFWFWELERFPGDWTGSFAYFDEIWVASGFVQTAVAQAAPIPVVKMPLALRPAPRVDRAAARAALGLPETAVVFLYMFDFRSVMERKNPRGLITAFREAFGDRGDALLVLKTANSDVAPASAAVLDEARRAPNIRVIDAVWPRAEVDRLLAACDCYVSLHRAEGFGVTIAEAMQLGMPVIATAYSANMDFTTPANSRLVRYRVVEIEEDFGPYRKGNVWAEPDLDHAAALMRDVVERPEAARSLGVLGRADVLSYLDAAVVGGRMRERLSLVVPR